MLVTVTVGLPAHADSVPDAYVVQTGDTLSSIAIMAGISVDRIVELNGLESPDTIFVGDALLLVEPTPVPTPARILHGVEAGDTLSSISRQFNVEVAALVAANGIEDPNALAVGIELVIPDVPAVLAAATPAPEPTAPPPSPTPEPTPLPPTPSPAATPTPTAQPTPTPTRATASQAAFVPSAAAGTYVVQRGDTLFSIAGKHGVTPEALTAANHLATPDSLLIGQRLIIPARAATAQPTVVGQPGAPNDIVGIARQYLGAPYLFGGTTPAGFDCSGFIYFVFSRAGRTIGRDVSAQYDSGPQVPREQLQPGDLVFFQNTYMQGLSHNGIYIGNGEFINAVNEESGIAISQLSSPYWAERWYGATRPRSR